MCPRSSPPVTPAAARDGGPSRADPSSRWNTPDAAMLWLNQRAPLVRESLLAPTIAGILSRAGPHSRPWCGNGVPRSCENPFSHPPFRESFPSQDPIHPGARILSRTRHFGNPSPRRIPFAPHGTGKESRDRACEIGISHEPETPDAGRPAAAPIQAPLDGGADDRLDPTLPPPVHPLGEVDQAVSGLPASGVCHFAHSRGLGIGSNG